ncbi:MAG: glycoside hydrolase family 4 [Rariglobus sp.]|jgi:alpha-galactosidase|nr:glycoside hydrolase family 4 [Rariglobus sp.]
MPRKITFIGGGSYQWVPTLFRDIAVTEALAGCRFVLHDIHAARNEELAEVCRIIARKLDSSVHIETAPALEAALEDADAVILCISTGGLDAMAHDIEIPKKYGIYQPVGDSTGPGGISRTLRNVPVVTRIARQMEVLCPHAWLINLSNPMDQIVRAIDKTSSIRVVGLCHEYMCFMDKLEQWFGLTDWRTETSATIAGINHFAWIKRLTIHGEDGLALMREHIAMNGASPAGASTGRFVNRGHLLDLHQVKNALFATYGLMPYPGDRHLVEFFPYFLSEKTGYGKNYGVELTAIHDRRTSWLAHFKKIISDWTASGPDTVPRKPSSESLAPTLAALFGGPATVQPAVLPNHGQIANLPFGPCVETFATIERDSITAHASGELPAAIVALTHKHCLNQDLTVEGAIEGDRTKVLHAMLADPLNNNNDFSEIDRMLGELMEANRALLPQFLGREVHNPEVARRPVKSPVPSGKSTRHAQSSDALVAPL